MDSGESLWDQIVEGKDSKTEWRIKKPPQNARHTRRPHISVMLSASMLLFVVMLRIAPAVASLPKDPATHVASRASIQAAWNEDSDHEYHHGPLFLIIDVDNTLYNEQFLQRHRGRGIEQQIVNNTHAYCLKHMNLSSSQADELFRSHGSTIEGLRSRMTPSQMKDYYEQVYCPIDVSCLWNDKNDDSLFQDATGYTHMDNGAAQGALPMTRAEMQRWFRSLVRHPGVHCYLASNSPSWHVHKVLCALGLQSIEWAGILTPDSVHQQTGEHVQGNDDSLAYPTKVHPRAFFRTVLRESARHDHARVVLLDDSFTNVRAAEELGMCAIQISHSTSNDETKAEDARTLQDALNVALVHVDETYEFSDVQYLRAKNEVDAQSIHVETWNSMVTHVRENVRGRDDTRCCVVDVGAGVLSMLELMCKGTNTKQPLFTDLLQGDVERIEYHAYEPNVGLLEACHVTLSRLGFESQSGEDDSLVFEHTTRPIAVHLHMHDFSVGSNQSEPPPPPHLIVGCCFADLMNPCRLVEDLVRYIGRVSPEVGKGDTIVYFPITFSGTTQFYPPAPFGDYTQCGRMPSDTVAFRLYSHALSENHGHSLDPTELIRAFESYGATLLGNGPSSWRISRSTNDYFWRTMLYFFGTTAARELLQRRWDSSGWIRRAWQNGAEIHVTNADLLFKLHGNVGRAHGTMVMEANNGLKAWTRRPIHSIQEIRFTAPNHVTTIRKPYESSRNLKPHQVEVTSVSSLISSGTELKIFKGLFDDAALDVNIKGMDEERMAYPLSYGYSLVGRVTGCGSAVADSRRLLGKSVFCFSPHASHAVVDRAAILLIPDEIDPDDAIFMPSVETALSLVHDANIRVGERIAVFGQGLIGLLVTSILRLQTSSADEIAPITVFDTIADRLGMASAVGASQALLPATAMFAGPFDVAVEVSGSSAALQSAIDSTRSGGRIIIGSWYGKGDVNLKLGIDFHRSHKTIRTSQVSELPAELTGLWSKERRFAMTWDLVRKIRPSRLISKRVRLDEAQDAYEALDTGKEIAVSFVYNRL